MGSYLPILVGVLIAALLAFKVAQWAERKNPALGTWVPVGFILLLLLAAYLTIVPSFPRNGRAGILQCFLLGAVLTVLAGWIGISRQNKAAAQRPTPRSSREPLAPSRPAQPSDDSDSSGYPIGFDLDAAERAQREKDAQEIWDAKYSEEYSRQREEDRAEAAERAEEAYWEERREQQEEQERINDIIEQQRWEEEQRLLGGDDDE